LNQRLKSRPVAAASSNAKSQLPNAIAPNMKSLVDGVDSGLPQEAAAV
jgi:hypothetical protein